MSLSGAGLLALLASCDGGDGAPAPPTSGDTGGGQETGLASDADTDVDADTDTDTDTDTGPPGLWSEVFAIHQQKCVGCHSAWGLPNEPDQIYASLLAEEVAGYTLVVPGESGESLYYLKATPGVPYGEQMPYPVEYLSEDHLALTADWIASGAQDDDTFADWERQVFGGYQCDGCHGEWAEGGLHSYLLETMAGGEELVVPGDAEASLLYTKLTGEGPGQQMPKKVDFLSEEEQRTLRTWIDAGAVFE